MKNKKLLLTTSSDKCVIIAEVENNHTYNEREYVISRDMLNANVNNGNFIEITDESEWENGRIWVFADDVRF
tara:strand:- start:287 stop:502 length:216 start_codon:yes stop_codon:yes gene_type:complete